MLVAVPFTAPPPEVPIAVAAWSRLADRHPAHAEIAAVDLVIVRYDDQVAVLFGRCPHRGALMADATVEGHSLVCRAHGWDYRYDSGVSDHVEDAPLPRFGAWIDVTADAVLVDEAEITRWRDANPQAFFRQEYLSRAEYMPPPSAR